MKKPIIQSYKTGNSGFFAYKFGLLWVAELENFDISRLEDYVTRLNKQEFNLDEYMTFIAPFYHELFHYYQCISTTYFLSLNELSFLNTTTTKYIVQLFQDLSLLEDIKYPLINHVQNTNFNHPIYAQYQPYHLSNLHGLLALQQLIESGNISCKAFDIANAFASYAVCQSRIYPFVKHPKYEEEILDTVVVLKELVQIRNIIDSHKGTKHTLMTFDFNLSQDLKTIEIIESAAVIASMWPIIAQQKNRKDALGILHSTHPKEYVELITYFYHYFGGSDVISYFCTFLSICDLALNPPLYWEYMQLSKNGNYSLYEFLPPYRYGAILKYIVENKIKPVSDHEDHLRFCKEVSHGLGWVDPEAMIDRGARIVIGEKTNNWIKKEHVKSQFKKIDTPWLYAIPGTSLFDVQNNDKTSPPCILMRNGPHKFCADESKYLAAIHWYVINAMHEDILNSNQFSFSKYFLEESEFSQMAKFYLKEWYGLDKLPFFD